MKPNRPVPLAMEEVLRRTEAVLGKIPTAFELFGLLLLSAFFVFVPVGELLADARPVGLAVLSLTPVFLLAPFVLRRFGMRRARQYARDRLAEWMREAAIRHHASVSELEPLLRPAIAEKMRED